MHWQDRTSLLQNARRGKQKTPRRGHIPQNSRSGLRRAVTGYRSDHQSWGGVGGGEKERMIWSTRRRRWLITTLLLLHVEAKALAIPWRRGQNAVRPPRLDDAANNTILVSEQDYGLFNVERETRRSKRILAPLPTRFFHGAKAFFGRAASVINDRRSSRKRKVTHDEDAADDGVDHTFDDLDQIIDKTSSNESDESLTMYHDDNLFLDTF